LTLSPALTALLLRPRSKEVNAPLLPRLAFFLIGAWAGWEFLAELLQHAAQAVWLPSAVGDLLAGAPAWAVPVGAALAAGVAGWLAGPALNRVLGGFFRAFNTAFVKTTSGYVRLVGGVLRVSVITLLIYGGLLAVTYFVFTHTKRGFIPSQDMGYLMVNVQLPDSASMERTDQVMSQIEQIALNLNINGKKGILHVTGIRGQSFVLNAAGSNFGSLFLNLMPYPERREPELSSDSIANALRKEFGQKIDGAMVAVFGPSPVRGVGRAGGFAIMVEDRGDFGPSVLQNQTENLVRKGLEKPEFLGMFTVFRANVPQFRIEPDARACMMRGVSMKDFADTLSVYTGSLYVNDFNLFGRTWQVIVQAEAEYRDQPEDVPQLRVRSARGAMVPVGSLASQHVITGPLVLTRYNMYPAASINGTAAPGVSSGQTIDLLERLAEQELPKAMAYEWTDMSYLEVIQGNTAMMIFGYAVIMVFLVLAAQYESWSLPLAVILVVPMCLLCSIIGVNVADMDINIFTQIGFVVLVGLASKNAILIVEFAKQQRHEGKPRREATLAACQLRLRPIVMTSFAFILGVVPLLMSTGAGAEMRRTLGTAVFGGMLGVTLFGIVLTPVFFFTIDWLGEARVFHSRLAHRLSAIVLDVVALRSVRMAAGHVVRRLKAGVAVPGRNGTVPKQGDREIRKPGDKEIVANGDSHKTARNGGQGVESSANQQVSHEVVTGTKDGR
jgi:multidrug efflux pump